MAKVRYIGPEERVTVPELGDRVVGQDETVEVPDHRFGAYVCQSTNWESVEEPDGWEPPAPPAASEAEPGAEADAPTVAAEQRSTPARKSRNTAKGDV